MTDRSRPARPGRPPATGRGSDDRPRDPDVPDEVTWHDLDREARAALRSLPKEMAERVGGHLAMAGLLVDEDPERARAHAGAARRLASRVAVVREAMALTAYACGDFETALAELRAYRRLSGDQSHLPLMADCERGLGRPARALELAASPEARDLPADVARELRIVTAGARGDLGQREAALALLEQDSALRLGEAPPGSPPNTSVLRLWYAYADALTAVGRFEEATRWFRAVAEADVDGMTDAGERLSGIED